MKCRPAPLMITQRTLPSVASAALWVIKASTISESSALSDAGRLRVNVALAPSRSSSRVVFIHAFDSLTAYISTRSSGLLPERARALQLIDGPCDFRSLVDEKGADRTRELGVGNGVRRTCGHGHQAARELVYALRTTLEQRDSPLDAKFDRLVITRFEMQAGNVYFRPPVAAPERRGAEDVQS